MHLQDRLDYAVLSAQTSGADNHTELLAVHMGHSLLVIATLRKQAGKAASVENVPGRGA